MDVDASFAEYVTVRWSTLYRLALLLAGAEHADAVTETAVARAYSSWRRSQEPTSADPVVKKILVNTAVRILRKHGAADTITRQGSVFDDPRVVDREELWSRISTLPPRQRAVIVLLYYEDLTEVEAARVLGSTTGRVKSEAFAALARHIDVATFTTRDLREELALRADEADVPSPPIASLLRQAREDRRHRTRRAVVWSCAAVAVVLIGTTLASVVDTSPQGRRDTATPSPSSPSRDLPDSLAKLPEGRPAADVAYTSRQRLHVDGQAVGLAERPSAVVQTPSHVFVAYASGTIVRISRSSLEIETVTDSAAAPMVFDPVGNVVAWPVVGPRQAKVVLQSVDTGGPLGEQVFPATPRCCANPFLVVGITQTGALIAAMPAANRAWVWDTAEGVPDSDGTFHEIEGLGNGLVDEVVGNELVVRNPPFHYAVGVLRDGVFLAAGRYRARAVDFGDPLRRRLVYVDDDGETHVRDRRPRRGRVGGGDVRLQLPVLDAGFASARWESTRHVLLDVSDDLVPYGALVRCDVVTGACEVAVRFDGPHLVAR